MRILRNFVILEGCDGSGTTTQLALLERRWKGEGLRTPVFWPTFEPTAGPVGELIRKVLKRELSMQAQTLARLFAADRYEHLYGSDGIVERCGRQELVVSDRYFPSSLVYQGVECGEELPRALNAAFPAPELFLFFDIDPQIAAKRLENRPFLEIYERLEFQRKVRGRYHSLLGEFQDAGVRVEIINATKSAEEVAAEVWRAVSKMPIFKQTEVGRRCLDRTG